MFIKFSRFNGLCLWRDEFNRLETFLILREGVHQREMFKEGECFLEDLPYWQINMNALYILMRKLDAKLWTQYLCTTI